MYYRTMNAKNGKQNLSSYMDSYTMYPVVCKKKSEENSTILNAIAKLYKMPQSYHNHDKINVIEECMFPVKPLRSVLNSDHSSIKDFKKLSKISC